MKARSFPEAMVGAALILAWATIASAQTSAAASGQSTTTQTTATQATTTTDSPSQSIAAQAATQTTIGASFWEPIGGVEVDTHGTGYMFFGPTYQRQLNDNTRLVARVTPNFLMYEFEELGGVTKVRSPGVGSMIGLRFGDEHWFQVGAGPSFKRRTTKFYEATGETQLMSESDWQAGVDLAADAYVNPTSRTNVHGMVNYGTADNYLWSRLAAKRQISNFSWSGPFAHFVGAEVMAQGNDDIRSLQLGGLVEFLHVKSSVSVGLRAGWKRSTFDFADDKTGPYFAIGYYQRIQ